MIDANANTVYVNSYMAEMLGYAPVEMQGKHLFFFMDEPAIESAKKYLKKRSEGIKENHTFDFTHKNGNKVFTTINTYPLLDNNGKYNGAVAAVTNITERKNLEESTHQFEIKFKSIFDSASISLAILNKNLQVLDANRKLCEKLEYSKNEICKADIFKILSPDDKNEISQKIADLLRGSSNAFTSEYKFLKKNGFVGVAIVNFFVFTEGQSGEQKMVFSLQDITDRKNLEQELFNREALFKGVLEYSTAAITIWDSELKNLYSNPVAYEIAGRDRNTIPRRILMRDAEPDLPHIYKKWEKRVLECFSSGKSSTYSDTDDFTGKTIISESRTSPILDKSGKVFAVAIIFRDITERKKNEQKLIANERLIALGKMATHLSHEIRSPLASIRMNLDYLSQNLSADNKQKKSFDLINGEIHRLNNLVKEILSFSGEFSIKKTGFDIKETIEKIEFLLKPNLKVKKIIFVNNVDSQIIYGDAEKIEGVLINLIENSIEAITSKGTIEIYSYHKSTENIYELFIKDTGSGVENSSKLFDPFYTTKKGGTGLGLSIAKNIIEKHGGTINLVSSKPGETIFQIKLLINEKINL